MMVKLMDTPMANDGQIDVQWWSMTVNDGEMDGYG